MLTDPQRDSIIDRPEYERYLTVNGLLVDMKQAEYEEKGEIRSRFLKAQKSLCNAIHYY